MKKSSSYSRNVSPFANIFDIILYPKKALAHYISGKIGLLLILAFLFSPLFIPFMTFLLVFKIIIFIILLTILESIYDYVLKDSVLLGRPRFFDFVRTLLRIIISPICWIAYAILIITALTVPVMSVIFFVFIILRIIYDTYQARDKWKRMGVDIYDKVNIKVSKATCKVCEQRIGKQEFMRVTDDDSPRGAYICEGCQEKFSPFLKTTFEEMWEVRKHLAYRRENLSQEFNPDISFETINYCNNYIFGSRKEGEHSPFSRGNDPIIYVDTKNETFKVVRGGVRSRSHNYNRADILNLRDVVDCTYSIETGVEEIRNLTEEDRRDAYEKKITPEKLRREILIEAGYDGVLSERFDEFQPSKQMLPRYYKGYSTVFVRISVNHPYTYGSLIELNVNPIYSNEPDELIRTYQSKAEEICRFFNKYIEQNKAKEPVRASH